MKRGEVDVGVHLGEANLVSVYRFWFWLLDVGYCVPCWLHVWFRELRPEGILPDLSTYNTFDRAREFLRVISRYVTCRFVGLLLVVKMLSSENDSLAREIWKAIGNKFLMRLLLPLARGRA